MQIRLYRVRWFFEHLEFKVTVSLLWSTLARNLTVRALWVSPPHPPIGQVHARSMLVLL